MRTTGRMLALLGMAMAANNANIINEVRTDLRNVGINDLRKWQGGYNSFKGMSFGKPPRHFNKKRHGKILRRKHAKKS